MWALGWLSVHASFAQRNAASPDSSQEAINLGIQTLTKIDHNLPVRPSIDAFPRSIRTVNADAKDEEQVDMSTRSNLPLCRSSPHSSHCKGQIWLATEARNNTRRCRKHPLRRPDSPKSAEHVLAFSWARASDPPRSKIKGLEEGSQHQASYVL